MSSFIAYLSRLKHVYRWGLMRNTVPENDMEHSFVTAVIAHTLALITNTRHGGAVDVGGVVTLAVFHDATEVLTGDLPTPIKYFDPGIYKAYNAMEEMAAFKLTDILPDDLKPSYACVFKPDKNSDEYKLVKAADRLAAYVKCIEELRMGNREFTRAFKEIEKDVKQSPLPAVKDFLDEFAPSFFMTLDQLGEPFSGENSVD